MSKILKIQTKKETKYCVPYMLIEFNSPDFIFSLSIFSATLQIKSPLHVAARNKQKINKNKQIKKTTNKHAQGVREKPRRHTRESPGCLYMASHGETES